MSETPRHKGQNGKNRGREKYWPELLSAHFRIRATMMAQTIRRLGTPAATTEQTIRTYRPRAIMVGLIIGEADGARRSPNRQFSNVSAGRDVRALREFDDDIRAGRSRDFGFALATSRCCESPTMEFLATIPLTTARLTPRREPISPKVAPSINDCLTESIVS